MSKKWFMRICASKVKVHGMDNTDCMLQARRLERMEERLEAIDGRTQEIYTWMVGNGQVGCLERQRDLLEWKTNVNKALWVVFGALVSLVAFAVRSSLT